MVAAVKPDRELTARETTFVHAIASGKGPSEAYRLAYDASKMTPASIKATAYNVSIRPHVEAKIAELKAKVEERMVLSRSRKRHILYEIAEAKRNKATDRIKAIEVDNRMSGDDAAIKIEGDITLISALGQLKHVEPVIELETQTHKIELKSLELPANETPVEVTLSKDFTMSVGEPEPATPSIPVDSSPFADSPPVFTPPAPQSSANAKRTRSYDE